MKKKTTIIAFIATLLSAFSGFAQADEDYTQWFFVQGDKAIQERYALVKEEGDMSYFRVQFRINFEDGIFTDVGSEGYVTAFSYPQLDQQSNIYKHFIFYNTFKGIHTMDELMPVKMKFPDGSKRFLSKTDGFMYELVNGQTGKANFFYNCVDNLMIGQSGSRCHGSGAWRGIFEPSRAVVLR
jgi:hypothetical protein